MIPIIFLILYLATGLLLGLLALSRLCPHQSWLDQLLGLILFALLWLPILVGECLLGD
jgi:hypothetical protein